MEEAPKILNNINEYVDLIASEVVAVYEKFPKENSILNNRRVEFKKYLHEYFNNAVIIKFKEKDYASNKKEYISCNDDVNRISSPIAYALTAIDFSTSFYPAKLCYAITPKLEVKSTTYRQAIYQDKKVAAVQQKILNMYNNVQMNRTISSINTDQITNREIKPQILADIIIEVNNIKNRHGQMPWIAINRLRKIWNVSKKMFDNNSTKPNYFVLELLNSCYEGELSKKYIDLAGKEAIKQIIKIDYCSQRKEVNIPSYTHTRELFKLSNLMNATTLHDRLLPDSQKVSLYLYAYGEELTNIINSQNEKLEPVKVKTKKLSFK